MAATVLGTVLHKLRRSLLKHEAASATDAELLECFVTQRDEAAFEALLRRHGPMVLGVCRRVLRNETDAEDAFQATFLVLVKKAASLRPRSMVGNWLYGVAHNTALKARAMNTRKSIKEREAAFQSRTPPTPEANQRLLALLDQELKFLPDKYRAAIVLCDLEGESIKDAARQLRLPMGTVGTRLARGRRLLARRFARHGLALSSASLAALTSQAASASVPVSLASTTLKAASLFAAGKTGLLSGKAVALAEGVLKTMLLTKLKITTAVLVTALALGSAAVAYTQQGPAPRQARTGTPQTAPAVQLAQARTDTGNIVNGLVKAVDVDKETLTVAHKGRQESFALATDTTLAINGRPHPLADLPIGAFVTLGLAPDLKTVRTLEAVGPQVGGVLKAMDADKNFVTIATAEGERSFTLTRNANIDLDNQQGSKLAAVPVGASVTVSWFVDQKTARNLQAGGRSFISVPVAAVDAAAGTITFGTERTPVEVAGKTFPVSRNAPISLDGKDGKLADLPRGCFVNLVLSTDQKIVRNLSAEGRSYIFVRVKAVNAEKNTITFGEDRVPPELAGKTFPVNDFNLRVDGRPGKLAEIPPGACVSLSLSVDQKWARNIGTEWYPLQNVTVRAVDPEKRTITFEEERAPAPVAGKTLAVAKDTNILIDGKPGKLAAIPKGAVASLDLSVDQKTVHHLSAEGPSVMEMRVKAVDADKYTITFEEDKSREPLAGKTFPVARGTRITIDGQPGALATIPKGAHVNFVLSVDRQVVRNLAADGPSIQNVHVKAVDADRSNITFDNRNGEPEGIAGKTFPVAKDAGISIDGKPGKLTAIPAGAIVLVALSADLKTVRNLSAEGMQVGGLGAPGAVVLAVDADKGTITVDINGEGEKTFAVAKDAAIQIDNRPGTLAGVPREAAVTLTLSVDQRTVRRIHARSS
jgi:RNA polymerase sigma factor (sigma-70 family)